MSILKKLEEARVVAFGLDGDLINYTKCDCPNGVEIIEMCDEWFGQTLTKEEFKQLIEELTGLYNRI